MHSFLSSMSGQTRFGNPILPTVLEASLNSRLLMTLLVSVADLSKLSKDSHISLSKDNHTPINKDDHRCPSSTSSMSLSSTRHHQLTLTTTTAFQ